LSRFTSLKRLTINISNTYIRRQDQRSLEDRFPDVSHHPTTFDTFVASRLTALAPKLEHLEILYQEDELDKLQRTLKNCRPSNFVSFGKLKTLVVPQTFLVEEFVSNAHPVDALPSSLETLTITHVANYNLQFPSLLEALAASRTSFPNLVKIVLVPIEGFAMDPTNMSMLLCFGDALKVLGRSGIPVFRGNRKVLNEGDCKPRTSNAMKQARERLRNDFELLNSKVIDLTEDSD
jgi:hypothetical protein